jgi:hypothetical protein
MFRELVMQTRGVRRFAQHHAVDRQSLLELAVRDRESE